MDWPEKIVQAANPQKLDVEDIFSTVADRTEYGQVIDMVGNRQRLNADTAHREEEEYKWAGNTELLTRMDSPTAFTKQESDVILNARHFPGDEEDSVDIVVTPPEPDYVPHLDMQDGDLGIFELKVFFWSI